MASKTDLLQGTLERTWDADAAARSALQASAIAWFVPALIGQWFFAYHIAATYIGAALAGNFAAWNRRLFVGLVTAKRSPGVFTKFATAALVLAAAAATSIGVYGTTMRWLS